MTFKRLAIVLVVLATLLVGAWMYARSDGLGDVPVPKPGGPPAAGAPREPEDVLQERERLHAARRLCALEPLDRFIHGLWDLVEAQAQDEKRGALLHVLAEAHLERIYHHTSHLGMRPGEALYDEVPAHVEADSRIGLMVLDEARKLGVALADGYRVEAGLLVARITGMFSAMETKRRVTDAYRRALELDPDNPRLHVALGCRKLFAPGMLGRDTDKALEHFAYACDRLPRDERPRIFAGLAAHLKGDAAGARAWLEKAVAVNDRNAFGVAVLKRLQRGEVDPFARDL